MVIGTECLPGEAYKADGFTAYLQNIDYSVQVFKSFTKSFTVMEVLGQMLVVSHHTRKSCVVLTLELKTSVHL